jgi:hypothetical protein
MLPRTVFLHCGWRTASTYLWSRFRALDNTVSYYEPLHENLARMTADGSDPNAGWDASKRSHPGQERPPFAEFVPLIKNGSVSGYHPRFATGNYFLPTREDDEPLRLYIKRLEEHAAGQGKHAVYGFCRSLGRAAWLRKHFPGAYNIVLTRRPYDHWRSCLQQLTEHRVPYFLLMPFQIVGENQRRIPELKKLAEEFRIPEPQFATRGYLPLLQRLPAEALLRIFLEVYALAYTHALSHADLVLSIEDFAAEEAYRSKTLGDIEAATGLRLSPGTINLTHYTAAPGDVFGGLDLRRISTLTSTRNGAIDRTAEAISNYGRALKADIARARRG